MKHDSTKNYWMPDYSEKDLGLYVFDGFEDFYAEVDSTIEDKGYIGIKDYRLIQESFIGTEVWNLHILQMRDNPNYTMTWHEDMTINGRRFTRKSKRLCNRIIINETRIFSCILGSITEEDMKKNVFKRMEGNSFPEELLGDLEDYYYTDEYWVKRFNDLRFLYWLPSALYSLFSDLVEINGMEWIDFILNDAKMDYIELSHQLDKKDSDMLTYLDMCAERVKLLNDKMISRKDKEYDYNDELLRIFHGDFSIMQKFLKNIQGLSGAAIVRKVKYAIEQGMINVEDSQMPLYKALKELGYPVTTPQNWSSAFSTKKSSPLIE